MCSLFCVSYHFGNQLDFILFYFSFPKLVIRVRVALCFESAAMCFLTNEYGIMLLDPLLIACLRLDLVFYGASK